MKRMALTVAGVLAVLVPAAGFGESLGQHEEKEQQRINQGVKKGKLTPKEQERLQDQQDTIEKERNEAWEDGKMSKRERKDIRHDQKRLGHDIHHKKHNEKQPAN